MSELNQLLKEYHDITQQLQALEERKTKLRDEISAFVQQLGKPTSVNIGKAEVRVSIRSTVTFKYDEVQLRQRLGERFRSVLDLDIQKIRTHLTEVRPCLEPYLELVGSVSDELVKQTIERGEITDEEVSGVRQEETKQTLYVRIIPQRISPEPERPRLDDIF